jgi:hypothetical protein
LYASNIIRVIKIMRMRWAGHVARMEEMTYQYKILAGEPERKRNHSEELGEYDRIILKGILGK